MDAVFDFLNVEWTKEAYNSGLISYGQYYQVMECYYYIVFGDS